MAEPRNIDDLLASDARGLPYPPTPNFALPPALPRRGRRDQLRRTVALAACALLVFGVALLLSSRTRTAVADFLGLAVEGERIEFVPSPSPGVTPSPVPTPLPLEAIATRRTMAEAIAFAGFVPQGCGGEPLAIYTVNYLAVVAVVLHYERYDCWQFELAGGGFAKQAFDGTFIENVLVNGVRGYWLQGGPRLVTFIDPSGAEVSGSTRVATRNTLLWAAGGRYYRIEGDLSREEAILAAESVR